MKVQQKRRGLVRNIFFLSDEAMVDYTITHTKIFSQNICSGFGFVFTETVSFKMFLAVHVLSHRVSCKTIKTGKNYVRNQLAQS